MVLRDLELAPGEFSCFAISVGNALWQRTGPVQRAERSLLLMPEAGCARHALCGGSLRSHMNPTRLASNPPAPNRNPAAGRKSASWLSPRPKREVTKSAVTN